MARTLTVMLWAELRSVVGGGLSSACLLVAVIMVVRFVQACLNSQFLEKFFAKILSIYLSDFGFQSKMIDFETYFFVCIKTLFTSFQYLFVAQIKSMTPTV